MTLIAQDKVQELKFYGFVSKTLGPASFQIYQLAGDASSRKYYRIVSDDKSYVLMEWEPFSENLDEYPLLSVLKQFEKHGVHTPKIVAKSPREGLLIQEDLGDLTLERKFWENQNQELVIPFYKQAIDELIKIHYPATFDKTNCHAFKIEFDTEKLLWEMNYAYKNLLEGLCKIQFTIGESKALSKDFTDICEILDKEEKFISHRDYHSRNLMLKFGKMRVIDFQDARLGPIQYDLVSLLKDSYVDLNPTITEKLLKYYLAEREKVFKPISDLKQFQHIYEIQSVQRCFKACGSFSSFFVARNDTRYLKYIHNTLLKVKSSLEKLGQHPNFLAILNEHKVFDRHFTDS
jgi:aminoglycoside/choline kinase family phosphotransferase